MYESLLRIKMKYYYLSSCSAGRQPPMAQSDVLSINPHIISEKQCVGVTHLRKESRTRNKDSVNYDDLKLHFNKNLSDAAESLQGKFPSHFSLSNSDLFHVQKRICHCAAPEAKVVHLHLNLSPEIIYIFIYRVYFILRIYKRWWILLVKILTLALVTIGSII